MNTITHHNYEAFFLLYADGELNAADRKAVEDFVAADPVKKQELELMCSCTLVPEDLLMEDKGELYKPIPIDAMLQEKLLLHLDGELAAEELKELEGLLTDTNVAAEWKLLNSARLTPGDTISFDAKESLYKRAPRRIVPFYYAAAAVLIGLTILFGIQLFKPGADQPAEPLAKQPSRAVPVTPAPPVDQLQTNMTASTGLTAEKPQARVPVKAGKDEKGQPDFAPMDEYAPEERQLMAKVSEPAPLKVTPVVKKEPIVKEVNELDIPALAKADISPEASYAMAVSARRGDEEGDKILYMDEDAVKRSGAGGVVRKLKSLVERTANIKPGKSLLIAGFEFRGRPKGQSNAAAD